MITIKDIALEAGVSISTVSKVINGKASISQATADKVNAVIAKHNYMPNSRAQNLAKGSTHTIAFVSKIEVGTAFNNPHIFEILSGADCELSRRKWSTVFVAIRGNNYDSLEELLAKQKIDGLLLHASALTRASYKIIRQYNVPVVVIGAPDFACDLCWIDNDNQVSGRIAAEHLATIGKRNIVYVGGESYDAISESRYSGAEQTIVQYFTNTKITRHRGQSTPEDGYYMTSQLLKQGNVDGIICSNNAIALGCINCLNDKGVAIPDNIAVVSFDDYPFARFIQPPLTVVNIDMFSLGEQASQLLMQKIKSPSLHVQTLTTQPLLRVRESTVKKQHT